MSLIFYYFSVLIIRVFCFSLFDNSKEEETMSSVLSMYAGIKGKVEIVGVSQEAKRIRRLAEEAALIGDTIFIRGETGAGKDHLAEYIHNLGRSNHRFVPIDCGAMPENLCEGELFGYSAGAFTDARKDKPGLIRVADRGTLFLNEVANMGQSLQAKFLRLLDTKTFRPIGGTEEVPMNTRIIAATNAQMEELVKSGKLRHDLYQRLNVITFTVLPLRERVEDIPFLAEYFLIRHGSSKKFSDSAIGLMMDYPWPGNIREMKHAIERAVFFSGKKDVIDLEDFQSSLEAGFKETTVSQSQNTLEDIRPHDKVKIEFSKEYPILDGQLYPSWETISEDFLKEYIIELLNKTNGNLSKTAAVANFTRGKLRERIAKFKISFRTAINIRSTGT